jgi:voltage-gated potassium channel
MTRRRAYEILWATTQRDHFARRVSALLILLIALNIISSVLETEHAIASLSPSFFHAFELFSVLIFSLEYLLRLWSCVEHPDYEDSWRGRLVWARSPIALIDLISILPFYLGFFTRGLDLRVLRALRLFRVFRIFKLGRYSDSFDLLSRVWLRTRADLAMGSFVVLMVVLFSASALWFVEQDLQPDAFGSIPKAMWWGIITVTTIGYGDVSPASPLGKVIASVIAYIGVCIFALPVGVVGAAFVDEIQERRKRLSAKAQARAAYGGGTPQDHDITCPHCNHLLNVDDLLEQVTADSADDT